MNTNLPMKTGNSFIDKIKTFFRKIFARKNINQIEETNDIVENEIIQNEVKTEQNEKSNFHDAIKVEVKNEYLNNIKREEFLKDIEANPILLYELPIEKLKILEKYYDDAIAECQEKLANLKKVV